MLTAAAGRQLHQARTWWLENRDKAPEAFDEELLTAVSGPSATIARARVHGKTFDAAELASCGDDTQWLHLYPGAGADAAARAWNEDRARRARASRRKSVTFS